MWPFVAKFLSVVFHPVFIPPMMALVMYLFVPSVFVTINKEQFQKLFVIIVLNTTFFSLVFIALLKAVGFLNSWQMPTTKDRIIPLLGVMVFYFWCYHVLNNLEDCPPLLRVWMLGNFWGLILVFLLNIFTKVSLHTGAMGAVLGMFTLILIYSVVNLMIPFSMAVLIAGLVGTARLSVGSHNLSQIILGFVSGFIVMFAAYAWVM